MGFTHEGVLRHWHRHGDDYFDVNVFGMLRSDWETGPLAGVPVAVEGHAPEAFSKDTRSPIAAISSSGARYDQALCVGGADVVVASRCPCTGRRSACPTSVERVVGDVLARHVPAWREAGFVEHQRTGGLGDDAAVGAAHDEVA